VDSGSICQPRVHERDCIVQTCNLTYFRAGDFVKENIHLEQELLAELSRILNRALVGLDRISRQPFTVPKASEEAVTSLQDLLSPMSAFVRDCCD